MQVGCKKDRFDSCNCFPATLLINTNKVKELQTSSQSYKHRRPKLPRAGEVFSEFITLVLSTQAASTSTST